MYVAILYGTCSNVHMVDHIPYKRKYWWEYYLAKCIEKHFDEINIGDLGEML